MNLVVEATLLGSSLLQRVLIDLFLHLPHLFQRSESLFIERFCSFLAHTQRVKFFVFNLLAQLNYVALHLFRRRKSDFLAQVFVINLLITQLALIFAIFWVLILVTSTAARLFVRLFLPTETLGSVKPTALLDIVHRLVGVILEHSPNIDQSVIALA